VALFVIAVHQVQDLMAEDLAAGDTTYVLGSERRSEAQVVDPCAAQFIEGEMNPQREPAVAPRFNDPLGAGVSLGEQLGAKLRGADEKLLGAVRLAAHKVLAGSKGRGGSGRPVLAGADARGHLAVLDA
jgi:hypothetical protein